MYGSSNVKENQVLLSMVPPNDDEPTLFIWEVVRAELKAILEVPLVFLRG